MNYTRWQFSRTMMTAGSLLLGLGILLLLLKFLMALAWYASGAIAVAGLIMLAVGWFSGGGTRIWR